MSQTAPDGIYVYQTFGSVTHPARMKSGRLYGLGGLAGETAYFEASITGLTKAEAQTICAALRALYGQEATP